MKKGLVQLLLANMVYLLISILNSFLLPRFVSVETYSVIKTYTLYIGYAGFLSLGYADGMYLRYGGGDIAKIELAELGANFKSYVLLEMAVSALCVLLSLLLRDAVLFAFALGSLFINIIGYYKNLYQAVGEYKLYGKALNYQTILMFALNVLLLFALQSDNPTHYILVQVATALVVMGFLTVLLHRRTAFLRSGKPAFAQIRANVSSGFVLMLGNFSSSILTSLDRWFVKLLLLQVDFAHYSFAVSLENIVNVFVTPITISLYNTFCTNRAPAYVRRIKRLVLLWGFVVIAAAFPVKFVVVHFLPAYVDALPILFPLFGAQAFFAVIKGIHVNLYKAEKQQKRYFFIMFAMIAVAVVTNLLFYLCLRTATAFALATYATAALWLLYCEIETKALHFRTGEYLTLLCVMAGYFYAATLPNALLGLGVYLLVLLLCCVLFMRATLREACTLLRSYLQRKRV